MNNRALSVPRTLREVSWSKLTLWQRRKLATHLVVALLYPSLRPSKKSQQKRQRAFRVLAAYEHLQDLPSLLSSDDATQITRNKDALQQIAGWILTLAEAPSYKFCNESRILKVWDRWAHVYLILVSLIRLRHAQATAGKASMPKRASQAMAMFLVMKTYPSARAYRTYERGKLETFFAPKLRPLWPIVCGLLYCFQMQRESERSRDGGEEVQHPASGDTHDNGTPKQCPILSVHELLPATPPTAAELIDCFIKQPGEVARAARYFQAELVKKESGKAKKDFQEPLLAPDAALGLPFKVKTGSSKDAVSLPGLSVSELALLSRPKYSRKANRRGNAGPKGLKAGAERLCRPFPCRAESPGEGQRPAVSTGDGSAARGTREMPRAIGRASALLSSRGGVMPRQPVLFLTIRPHPTGMPR